jgi:hypothetical protein
MQEGLLRGALNLPGESRKGSKAPAVLADLDGAFGGEFLQAGLQFDGEVHAKEYKGNNWLWNYYFLEVNSRPETRTRGC